MPGNVAPSRVAPSLITVIVPTYNRGSTLRLCLAHLEGQSTLDFDVLVINDGSSDDTEDVIRDFVQRGLLRLRVLRQANAGPSRGRNRAIAEAETPLLLFIGDDILTSPTLIEAHLQLHKARPERRVAGLGLTQWDTEHQRVTPLMKWLEDLQFDYTRLLGGLKPDFRHFYTSNLSCKTELLRENRFDEGFRHYGFEDVELGFRLRQVADLEIVFLEHASATHVHPTSLTRALSRMRSVGQSEHQFHRMWPSAAAAEETPGQRIVSWLGSRVWLLELAISITHRVPERLRPRKWVFLLLFAQHKRGYLEYAEEE